MGNLWVYRIYRQAFDDQRAFVAEYVAETSADAVKKDLASKASLLRAYFATFGADADLIAKEHPERAESILGGLCAKQNCMRRTPYVFSLEPPAGHVLPANSELGDRISSESDPMVLWLRSEVKDSRVFRNEP